MNDGRGGYSQANTPPGGRYGCAIRAPMHVACGFVVFSQANSMQNWRQVSFLYRAFSVFFRGGACSPIPPCDCPPFKGWLKVGGMPVSLVGEGKGPFF